jgi:hypothetical protein
MEFQFFSFSLPQWYTVLIRAYFNIEQEGFSQKTLRRDMSFWCLPSWRGKLTKGYRAEERRKNLILTPRLRVWWFIGLGEEAPFSWRSSTQS